MARGQGRLGKELLQRDGGLSPKMGMRRALILDVH